VKKDGEGFGPEKISAGLGVLWRERVMVRVVGEGGTHSVSDKTRER